MKKLLLILLFLSALTGRAWAQAPAAPAPAAAPAAPAPIQSTPLIKVVCVGDSITWGYGVYEKWSRAYPSVLQSLLGPGYAVSNNGSSGATLLQKGDQPIWGRQEFKDALAANPQIAIIMLGTNDGRPANFDAHPAELGPDLLTMVQMFKALPSKPKVYVALPAAIGDQGGFGIVAQTIREKVVPTIRETAEKAGLPVIDTYTPLRPHVGVADFYVDDVHPGYKGAAIIALQVARALMAPPAGANVESVPYASWENTGHNLWSGANVDGFDFEWNVSIPVITLRQGAAPVGTIRLRRDNGKLCLFAEVHDATPFPASETKDVSPLFGRVDGIELLLAPEGANRKTAGPGDARLFFTAIRGAEGVLAGQALAWKPASKGTLDLSKKLTPITDAQVRVRERVDGRGYFLEAEMPLALFPEVTRQSDVTANRADGASTSRQLDLLPLRLNAAIWQNGVGSVPAQRIAWRGDGKEIGQLNPSAWAKTGYRVPVSLTVGLARSSTVAMRYETTKASSFSFYSGPYVRVSDALIGGGWIQDNGAKFVTTPLPMGFSLEAGPGAGFPQDEAARTPKLMIDGSRVNFANARGQHSFNMTKPTTATVKVNFPPGHGGRLHVLWGGYTGNSYAGAAFKITDVISGQVIDATKEPALTYQTGFNVNFEARETIVAVGGQRTFQIEVIDTQSEARAYLQGLWIEPVAPSPVSIGQAVTLAAYVKSPVQKIEFFAGGKKLGETLKSPYVLTWKPTQPGSYTISARATDPLGAVGESQLTTIEVIKP